MTSSVRATPRSVPVPVRDGLAVLATVVLVLGVDALGMASFAIAPAATAHSIVALGPMHVFVAAMSVGVLRYWRAER